MPSDNDYSLSGDPLVGVAKDWAGKTPPKELCMELFCRVLQLSVAVKWLCAQLGITIDEAARRGALEAMQEIGLPTEHVSAAPMSSGEGVDNGAPSNTSDTGH